MNNYAFNKQARNNEPRINHMIRVPQVRVVRDDEQLGIMSTEEAKRLAEDNGLDLVEIVANSRPPVCRIMDYNKHKYEQKIKRKEAEKKQRESQSTLKEIRFRPGIAEHDAETKTNQARKFLEEGYHVQFNLQFKGQRELSHKEQGFNVLNKVIKTLETIATVERYPKMDGNRISCVLVPKIQKVNNAS